MARPRIVVTRDRNTVVFVCTECSEDRGRRWQFESFAHTDNPAESHAADLIVDHLVLAHDEQLADAEREAWALLTRAWTGGAA